MRVLARLAMTAALSVAPTVAAVAQESRGQQAPHGARVVQMAAMTGLAIHSAQDNASPYMRVFGVTPPPYGHVEFCQREPSECRDGPLEEARRAASPAVLAELDRINRQVNTDIKPTTDREQYGVEDYWTLPRSGKGDCEDYALLKRHMLMKSGWPASALLMTVVFDEHQEGHAVLTARTADGDYILDNKTDTIKLWSRTNYHYVMRQSYLNARVWMSLDPKAAVPSVPMPVAGMRSSSAQ